MPRRRHAVTALLGAGLLLTAGLAPAASAVPATPAAPPAVRINAGGPALTDAQGVRWAADSLYAGGSTAAVTRTLTGTSCSSAGRCRRTACRCPSRAPTT